MTIVSPADFVGPELNIANTDTVPVQEAVQWMIDEYEPILLRLLLGETLYYDLLAGLIPVAVVPATDPVTYVPILPKWTALRDKVKPAIVRYVWFFWIESQINQVTGSGTKTAENDNSTAASSWGIQCTQWNKMVRLNYQIHKFLVKNKTDYPDFVYADDCFLRYFLSDLAYCETWYGLLFEFLGYEVPDIYRFKNSLGL